MAFRKFRAARLFNGYGWAEEGQVLVTKTDGTVDAILPLADAGDDVEELDGILSPGFINCHCHLELSHLKNLIPPHTGLVDFLCSVVTKRDFAADRIQEEIAKAEKEMYQNGTVAVGDIGNTPDALRVKKTSAIRWHNFIEVLSLADARAGENIMRYQAILNMHLAQLPPPGASVLTPHAPYSVSPTAFAMLNGATAGQTISIHNQESTAENELYRTGAGGFLKLFRIFGMDKSPLPVTGRSSLQSYLPYFNKGQTLFLVHNTYTVEEDILFANRYAKEKGLKLVYCFCPNANLYIENTLPPVDLFVAQQCHMVMGTDSYGSNWQLSMAKEIQAMHKNFPSVSLATILQWATSNGASALHCGEELGSFKKGTRPGIVLLAQDLGTSQRIL